MCPPDYHHTGCVEAHKLGDKMYGYTLFVFKNQRVRELQQETWLRVEGTQVALKKLQEKKN